MAYYSVCPKCGCNLDPEEKCECETEETEKQDFYNRHLKIEPKAGQLVFVFEGREAAYEKKSYC